MPEPSIDTLRGQLRERGYLTHGLERWFALDPWSSRTFWVELTVVALKAATLIAAFAALPHTAVMLLRNGQAAPIDTLVLFLLYAGFWFVGSFLFFFVVALLLKLRPELAIDTPRALLAISIGAAALLTAPLGLWWVTFEAPPTTVELAIGLALAALYFVVSALVISAALLSFSIYELHRIPAIHQRPRTVPLAVGAAVLIALMFVPARAREEVAAAPQQIVTAPSAARVALVAVDGLTWEIAASRPDLLDLFQGEWPATPVRGASAAERWASLGTGVPARLHGVRALTGVRLTGGRRLLQDVSRSDLLLRTIAPAIGAARIQPLPPTVRRRHFVWESFAGRGIPAVAVNWWTSSGDRSGALTAVGQETIFGASRGEPLRVDATAIDHLRTQVQKAQPRFATVYLPALDVILNRLGADRSDQLAQSLRAIDGVVETVRWLRSEGYEVLLIGLPGEAQSGRAVVASTTPLTTPSSAWDVAPTLTALLGFPASAEMPGQSAAPPPALPRIATYGERTQRDSAAKLNQEYFESLRSLGYIR